MVTTERGRFTIKKRAVIIKVLLILIAGIFLYFVFVNGMAAMRILSAGKNISEGFPDASEEQKQLVTEIYRIENETSKYSGDVEKMKKIRSEERVKEYLENEIKDLKERKDSMKTEAFGDTPKKPEYRKMSQKDAKALMDSGETFILLDVRTKSEYDEKHISGAVLIPNTELKSRAETELPDKDALILVYCRSGGRSESSSRALVMLGYTNVYDIGGISSWPYDNVI